MKRSWAVPEVRNWWIEREGGGRPAETVILPESMRRISPPSTKRVWLSTIAMGI